MRVVALVLAGNDLVSFPLLLDRRSAAMLPFAGKYRLIDFTLSNCANSGIYTVGVVVSQFPWALQQYIRLGRPWDLDRSHGGITLLPPHQDAGTSYRGTFDAIVQNLDFVLHYRPDYVLILKGSSVYKMNYGPLVTYHRERGADLTVVTTRAMAGEGEAPIYLLPDPDQPGRVSAWKPHPSAEAEIPLDVYVFTPQFLVELLEGQEGGGELGRDLIPSAIERKARVYTYPFEGYWFVPRSIQSYCQAHMDLLADVPPLDLLDRGWVILSRGEEYPPANVRPGATIVQSLISEGCVIEGHVKRSVLSPGVRVEPGAVVLDSILFGQVTVCSGAVVSHAILDARVTVGSQAAVGAGDESVPANRTAPELNAGITLVGADTQIPSRVRVGRNCLVGAGLLAKDFPPELPSGSTLMGG